ncbi:MAG: hypothetical protein LBS90_00515 [Oscillospiraceae bacterium]|jgi:hypothetical protein|nr:hypothetical protein [Oscillospiraceae bacterium]
MSDETYNLVISTPMGDLEGSVTLTINGGALSGTFAFMGGKQPFSDGTIDGDGNIAFAGDIDSPLGKMPYSVSGTLKDGKLEAAARTAQGNFIIKSK